MPVQSELWFYLYFPTLALDVRSLKTAGEISEQPCAIYHAQSNQLVQINWQAQQAGVKVGQGLANASASCPGLHIFEPHSKWEESFLHTIVTRLYRFLAEICIDQRQGVFILVTPMLQLYGSSEEVARAITRFLDPIPVSYVLTSFYSPLGAKVIAKQIAKTRQSTRQQSAPLRLSVLPERAEQDDAVKEVSLDLVFNPKVSEKLARVGLRRLGELKQIDYKTLSTRLDNQALDTLNRVFGEKKEILPFYHPQPKFHEFTDFDYEVKNIDQLSRFTKELLSRLETFLYEYGSATTSIEWQLHFKADDELRGMGRSMKQRQKPGVTSLGVQPVERLTMNAASPTYRAIDWQELTLLKLESVSLIQGCQGLGLTCQHMETLIPEHQQFWKDTNNSDAMASVSRLQSRLGEDCVFQLRTHDDHRPHRVSQLHTGIPNIHEPLIDRPGLLLKHPQRLESEFNLLSGPERIQVGWWDGDEVAHDYYVAELPNGDKVSIFKPARSRAWYLNGYFI